MRFTTGAASYWPGVKHAHQFASRTGGYSFRPVYMMNQLLDNGGRGRESCDEDASDAKLPLSQYCVRLGFIVTAQAATTFPKERESFCFFVFLSNLLASF